ncbi:MAG: histidinol dehydrogenase [Dehalococcoidales bacterium]|nr:histidinol dehydrogenase [Dehalococcoidales bacterium]
MIIIEGFQLAKSALSRQAPTEFYPVSPALRQRLKEVFGTDDPEQAVRQIVNEVRNRGDAALFNYTLKIDGIELTSLEVSKQQINNAYWEVDQELVSALKLAADQIRSFHITQRGNIWCGLTRQGLGQLIRPLERIGVYVPGGTACYPSTVLMTAIPAKVAGVKEIILATPPGLNGAVPPPTLVAANMGEVDRIFCVGGAQAIAALAFGTKSIPRVDKICGPGNIFVVLAKKMVYGAVDIDGLQGPSEVLIIADETANPKYCAADLLAQAEHDPLASAILITTSQWLADEVNQEVEQQLQGLERQTIAAESLGNRGMIVVVTNVDEAIELANLYAPEHLCLMVDKADSYVNRVSNAGCIFIGENSTVVLGDYVAGPSHVLPTGGTARFSSPLNIGDFIKLINLVKVDEASLKRLGQAAAIMARTEGFEAHARAVGKRLKAD